MEGLNKLKEILYGELEEYSRKSELTSGSLEAIHKITDTIKNIDKIEMLEEYGESDESYEGGGSYAGRRGSRYVHGYYRRGSYNNGGGSYNNEGGSYGNGGGGSYGGGSYGGGSYEGGNSGRRYSRDDGKDHMIKKMREMMDGAEEPQREAIRHCIEKLERM